MKNLILTVVALLALAVPPALAADHAGHGGGSHDMGHSGHQGDVAHDVIVDGVKAVFKVISMKEHMQATNMQMTKGVTETHHLAVEFTDVKSGKALTAGEVKVKVQNPDKSEQSKELTGMQGHFGADFDLSRPGKYGVMCKFLLQDGKTRSAKFWYPRK